MNRREKKCQKDECRAPDGAIEREKFHEVAPLRDGHSARVCFHATYWYRTAILNKIQNFLVYAICFLAITSLEADVGALYRLL
jgi:hypothetical protein